MTNILGVFLFSLFLTSCATTKPVSTTLEAMQLLPDPSTGISQIANNLQITLYPFEAENTDRKDFYQKFTQKGFLPLQISVTNPTENTYSFEKVQYAICDPDYRRIRRISPKNMAIMDAEIVFSGGDKKKRSMFLKMKKKRAAARKKKDYTKAELQFDEIPPYGTLHGWLYFQVKEGEFKPKEFFSDIQGYQLEIAHVKDLNTNIVNNFYFELDKLA